MYIYFFSDSVDGWHWFHKICDAGDVNIDCERDAGVAWWLERRDDRGFARVVHEGGGAERKEGGRGGSDIIDLCPFLRYMYIYTTASPIAEQNDPITTI